MENSMNICYKFEFNDQLAWAHVCSYAHLYCPYCPSCNLFSHIRLSSRGREDKGREDKGREGKIRHDMTWHDMTRDEKRIEELSFNFVKEIFLLSLPSTWWSEISQCISFFVSFSFFLFAFHYICLSLSLHPTDPLFISKMCEIFRTFISRLISYRTLMYRTVQF